VLEVHVPDGQEHDRLIRPAAAGRTTLHMREGVYSGILHVEVRENGC
jgi:hypothetical protein